MQRIKIETNGRFKSTKVYVNDKEINCKAINISGSETSDLDIIVTLALSKITKAQLDEESQSDRIGFVVPDEEDYEDEE